MKGSITSRYARRSLFRNGTRTALSVIGVAIGVGLGLFGLSWAGGVTSMMVQGAANSGIGHLRLSPEGWTESRDGDLRLHDWERSLEALREAPGVEVATPRVTARALLGMGTRSANVVLTGVDPSSEQAANRLVREVAEGRYLREGERGAIVLGKALAERLNAELEDELVVTVVDDQGEMRAALLRVVGLVRTGSRDIDLTIAQAPLEELSGLTGRPGAASITLLVEDFVHLDEVHGRLAAREGVVPEGDELLTWMDVAPELRIKVEGNGTAMRMAIIILLLVVLLGVASAQLTGVLERRKEFAVLAALGMRGVQLVKVLLMEGLVLGLLSAFGALAWSMPIIYLWARDGIDFGAIYGPEGEEGLAFGGALLDPILYPEFGAFLIPTAFGLALVATLAASLYPAYYASKSDPAAALRVDR